MELKVGDKTIELPYTEATKDYFTFSAALTETLKADQKDIAITYKGKTVSQTITVIQDYAETITLSHTEETMSPGQELTLTATLTLENIRNKDVKWICSDDKVAISCLMLDNLRKQPNQGPTDSIRILNGMQSYMAIGIFIRKDNYGYQVHDKRRR